MISSLPLEDAPEAAGSFRKWWLTELDTGIEQSPCPQEDYRLARETGVHTVEKASRGLLRTTAGTFTLHHDSFLCTGFWEVSAVLQ